MTTADYVDLYFKVWPYAGPRSAYEDASIAVDMRRVIEAPDLEAAAAEIGYWHHTTDPEQVLREVAKLRRLARERLRSEPAFTLPMSQTVYLIADDAGNVRSMWEDMDTGDVSTEWNPIISLSCTELTRKAYDVRDEAEAFAATDPRAAKVLTLTLTLTDGD